MTKVRHVLTDLFEELALTFGGLSFVYEIPDDAIWSFIQSADALRRRAFRRLDGTETPSLGRDWDPHPAIQEFLLKIRKEGNEVMPLE